MTRAQKLALAATLIAAYFFALTWRGLLAYFTGDDLTNIQFLHGFGQRPFAMLLVHTAVVITPEYRPLGGAVYRVLFALFGLDPLPFRVFCYSCLFLNLALAGILLGLIAESRAVAAMATLIFAVHTCMGGIYFNTGTIYDILCFTFGIAALIVYVASRTRPVPPVKHWRALFIALYCLALDCKEMAATWPMLLLAWELAFYRRAKNPVPRALIALSAAIAVAYTLIKTQVPNQMSITPAYIPTLSWTYVAGQLNHYYSLLLWSRPVENGPLFLCLAVLLLSGVALRNRVMVFGFLFANVALLPLLSIAGRWGFVWYIPWLGWALYLGSFFSRLIDLAASLAHPRFRGILQGACFLILLATLYAGQRNTADHMGDSLLPQQRQLQALHDALADARPDLAPGSRILLADDSLGHVDWTTLFLVRLFRQDATLWVDRPSQLGASFDPGDVSIYSAIVHAGTSPIRLMRGEPISHQPSASIRVAPAAVNRGDFVAVEVEGYPQCRLDAEYRLPDDELARSGLWKNWCTLDADGKCRARIDQDAERGIVQIRRIRLCGDRWRRTEASFEILP